MPRSSTGMYQVISERETGRGYRADKSYEMQLKGELRGKGMGKVLMDEMERIGRERGMSKCMLTCLSGQFTQFTTMFGRTAVDEQQTNRRCGSTRNKGE